MATATEQEKADVSLKRGVTAAHITDSAERQRYIAAQGEAEAKGGRDKTADLRQADYNKRNVLTAIGNFKKGGTAKKTGPYLLHAGEKVSRGNLHGGSERLAPDSMKGLYMLGRNSNLDIKSDFKSGAQDGRDDDFRSPAAQAMSKRAAVPRKRKS